MAFYGILEPCPGNINSANRSLLQGTQQPQHYHALAPHNASIIRDGSSRDHKVTLSTVKYHYHFFYSGQFVTAIQNALPCIYIVVSKNTLLLLDNSIIQFYVMLKFCSNADGI